MSTLYATLADHGLSPASLARMLDVHRSQLTRWAKKGVPPKQARKISEITGIAPHILRPDIFPAPSREAGK